MKAPKNVRQKSISAEQTPATYDKFDLAILRELLTDSRRTLQEIGATVKLSPTTCWSRIKRLEADGVIKRYTVDVERTRLGYQDTVIVQLTLASHTDQTLYEFGRILSQIPEVMDAYLVSGDYDYYIRIAVKDTRLAVRRLTPGLDGKPGNSRTVCIRTNRIASRPQSATLRSRMRRPVSSLARDRDPLQGPSLRSTKSLQATKRIHE